MSNQPISKLVYLDTSIFAGKVLLSDKEDQKCVELIEKISNNELDNFTFVTSKFTLIELAELICRKKTQNEAKALLFDIMHDPNLKIMLLNPQPAHKKYGN